MNRKADFTHAGGLYTYQDTLDFMQSGFSQPLDAIANVIGSKVIISGCVDLVGQLSAGWISFNGEILPFTGGIKAPFIIVDEMTTNEQYDDNVQRPFYTVRRLKFGNVVGSFGGFPASDLRPLSLNSPSIANALNAIESTLQAIVFESEVILSGLSVTLVPSFSISSGTVMFSGRLVNVSAYAGTYPVYLKNDGSWSAALPAGSYIKFDPHTSQRYADVLRRFTHQTGDILMSKVLTDRFDPVTGVGRWEWLGFRLSADLRGRVPVGLWFGDNGSEDVYDPEYREITNTGGQNRHTLTIDELPVLQFDYSVPVPKPGPAGVDGTGYHWEEEQRQTNILGGGQSHSIQQPYYVIAYIERF